MTYVTVLTNGHNCRAAGNCRGTRRSSFKKRFVNSAWIMP